MLYNAFEPAKRARIRSEIQEALTFRPTLPFQVVTALESTAGVLNEYERLVEFLEKSAEVAVDPDQDMALLVQDPLEATQLPEEPADLMPQGVEPEEQALAEPPKKARK